MVVEDNLINNSITFTARGPLQPRQDPLKRTNPRFQCLGVLAGDGGSLVVMVAKFTLNTGRDAALTWMYARTSDLLRYTDQYQHADTLDRYHYGTVASLRLQLLVMQSG